jgi:hypothetical protein
MAREHLDDILDALIDFAQQQLQKRGSFHPFAVEMKRDRSIGTVMTGGGSEHPDSLLLITELRQAIQSHKSEIVAAGICSDTRVSVDGAKMSDAICCELEGSDGEAVAVYLPYKKRTLRGIEYGEIFGTKSSPLIWSTSAG